MKKFFNINTMLIGGVLVMALALLVMRNSGKVQGGVAAVQIDKTKNTINIKLSEDKIYTIDEGEFTVTLEVKDGRIRFINSLCPDHICEGYGFISMEDDSAICLPAGVAVLIMQ